MPRRLVVSAIAIAVLLFLGTYVFGKLKENRKPPAARESTASAVVVRTQAATRTSYRERFVGYGRARALRSTPVSAQVAAEVKWISKTLEAGAAVSSETELVKLDPRDLEQTWMAADARVRRVEARIQKHKTDVEKTKTRKEVAEKDWKAAERVLASKRKLKDDGFATQNEIDEQEGLALRRRNAALELEGRLASLENDGATLAADLAEAVADRARAKLDWDRCIVKAPWPGRVEERTVQQGQLVTKGEVLFRLVDLSRVEVPIPLPASRHGDVRAGAGASVRLAGHDEVLWTGKVSRVAPKVRTDDRTFDVYLVAEGEKGTDAPIPPGAFVVATVDGPEYPDIVVIPRTAFLGRTVFVAVPDPDRPGGFKAAARTPTILKTLSDVVLLRDGVHLGEPVILTNLGAVSDGTRVRPEPAASGSEGEDSE